MAINSLLSLQPTIYQSVDRLYPNQLGGFANDPVRIGFNLEQTGEDVNRMVNALRLSPLPTVVYHRGLYIILLQFEGAFENPRMWFIHTDADLAKYFDKLAGTVSPKTLQGIYVAQQRIKQETHPLLVVLTTELPGV